MPTIVVYLVSALAGALAYPVGVYVVLGTKHYMDFLDMPWVSQSFAIGSVMSVVALGLLLTPYICMPSNRTFLRLLHLMGGCAIICSFIWNCIWGYLFWKVGQLHPADAFIRGFIIAVPVGLSGFIARAMFECLRPGSSAT